MNRVVRRVALAALCASAMIAASQSSQAAVLFDITNGAAIPAFDYGNVFVGGTNVGANNVINGPGVPVTGSTVSDPTPASTSEWLGTAGGSNSFLSVIGLDAASGQTYTVNFKYIGSESGDVVQFSSPGLPNFNETNLNNNLSPAGACCSGAQGAPVDLGTSASTTNTVVAFTVTDTTQAGPNHTVTNGGTNPAPNNGNAASLIFSYVTRVGGLLELTTERTDMVVFGFNDNGFADDNHDDFMGLLTLIPGGGGGNTPLPAALPLFGSVLGGGFLFRRLRKRRQARAA